MIGTQLHITIDPVQVSSLKNQMAVLMMPAGQRKKLIRFVAYRVRRDCQKRVRDRKSLNGGAMAPHPGHTKKQHAIDIIVKVMGIIDETNSSATLGWKKSYSADLAYRIHNGSDENVKDDENTQIRSANGPCSKWQAKQLVAYGYRQNGEKKKPLATVRWLRGTTQEGLQVNFHVTFGKAAVILDDIRRRGFKGSRMALGANENEKVKIPARPFLGATPQEIVNYIDTIFEQMKKDIRSAK